MSWPVDRTSGCSVDDSEIVENQLSVSFIHPPPILFIGHATVATGTVTSAGNTGKSAIKLSSHYIHVSSAISREL